MISTSMGIVSPSLKVGDEDLIDLRIP